jgi:mannose-6-phosphate isomerase-like protein (cupin superfamily)
MISPSEGAPVHETIRIGRLTVTCLKTAYETHDSLDLFEMTLAPGGSSLIPHMHAGYDEIIFGMNGIVKWTIGGRDIPIGRGDKYTILRGAPHFYINEESVPARFMLLHTPGVMGPQYFRELATCIDREGTPDLDCIVAAMMRYGATPLMHAPSR